MKLRLYLLFLVLPVYHLASAQLAPGTALSAKIADRMRDTLGLTPVVRNQIFDINENLSLQKHGIRQQYSSMDSVRIYVQQIEKTRDSLYQLKLTPEQYTLYKQRKFVLISGN